MNKKYNIEQRIKIGYVTEIYGSNITILMDGLTNLETIQYVGKNYKGVSSGSFVGIVRGSNIIVCRVVKEVLIDKDKNPTVQIYVKNRFKRELLVKILGNIRDGQYTSRAKIVPLIFNDVILLDEVEQNKILEVYNGSSKNLWELGKDVFENIPIRIGVNNLFNTHIGIFGNTGSGKSNTLAQLYTSLFNKLRDSSTNESFESSFIFFDFNNEYGNCFCNCVKHNNKECKDNKQIMKINNNSSNEKNKENKEDEKIEKIKVKKEYFWDIDLFIALLNPSEKEQLPVLEELIEKFKKENSANVSKKIFYLDNINKEIETQIEKKKWNTKMFLESLKELLTIMFELIEIKFNDTTDSDNKIKSNDTTNDGNGFKIWIYQFYNISLKDTKIISLLIANALYKKQKNEFNPDNKTKKKTIHLIIDEAHNILSDKSMSESNERNNNRLGFFEGIIKEGRKFRFFLTISTQRPSEISSTLISQLHNFFIHRLANKADLNIIENSTSDLDTVSYNEIPSLNPGECILSGVGFKHPIIIQMEELADSKKPISGNENLEELWFKP